MRASYLIPKHEDGQCPWQAWWELGVYRQTAADGGLQMEHKTRQVGARGGAIPGVSGSDGAAVLLLDHFHRKAKYGLVTFTCIPSC